MGELLDGQIVYSCTPWSEYTGLIPTALRLIDPVIHSLWSNKDHPQPTEGPNIMTSAENR